MEIGTEHIGNRSQTVSDSNNVTQTDISGSENIININPPHRNPTVFLKSRSIRLLIFSQSWGGGFWNI